MLFATRYGEYDAFAWFYDRYWGSAFSSQYYDVIEKMVLSRLSRGSSILDLCCGSGQLAARLQEAGYRVTCLDGSAELLSHAHRNAPGAELVASDARSFTIIDKFDAVLCTYDSLNCVQDLIQLANVFNNVYTSLRKEGRFFFDMSTEEGFKVRWHGASSIIETDHLLATNASYDSKTRQATMNIATFELDRKWKRTDVRLVEHYFTREEVLGRLAKSHFRTIKTFDAQKDFAKNEIGRLFYLCEK